MANRPSFQDKGPAERAELADRLRTIVEAVGTQSAAAQIAGVSLGQLKNYLRGDSAPSLLAAGNLCMATGHSLDWLMTGRPGSLDAALGAARPDLVVVRQLIDPIRDLYRKAGLELSPEAEDLTIGPALDALYALPQSQWGSFIETVLGRHREALARRRTPGPTGGLRHR